MDWKGKDSLPSNNLIPILNPSLQVSQICFKKVGQRYYHISSRLPRVSLYLQGDKFSPQAENIHLTLTRTTCILKRGQQNKNRYYKAKLFQLPQSSSCLETGCSSQGGSYRIIQNRKFQSLLFVVQKVMSVIRSSRWRACGVKSLSASIAIHSNQHC